MTRRWQGAVRGVELGLVWSTLVFGLAACESDPGSAGTGGSSGSAGAAGSSAGGSSAGGSSAGGSSAGGSSAGGTGGAGAGGSGAGGSGGSAAGGSGGADPWPLPRPGSPGAGPACPEPLHGPIGANWPEVFVGVSGCDATGDGSRATPFCTLEQAVSAIDSAPGIVTFLDGTYRGGASVNRRGTRDAYFVIRAAEGARPVVLGSAPLAGADFEASVGGTQRVSVAHLDSDPAGLWTAEGSRLDHVMEMREGVRRHANVSALQEPGAWTKADAAGQGCGDDNAGCYIYLLPRPGMDVGATAFEASQHGFIYSNGGDFLVVDGISTRFTQSSAIFTESAVNVLIENGDFAHNANSNDNSYNLRLWGADGAIVRKNRVSDSRYWGGAVNSHGITFMVGGEDQDIWVCENEVFDGVGNGVSTKNGSSNVHVVGNYLHDLGTCVLTSDHRCDWQGCDVMDFGGGAYDVRENLFERCGTGVMLGDRALETPGEDVRVWQSRIYNNVFVETERGVSVRRVAKQPLLRNNLFLSGNAGLYFEAGGETTWPDYYLSSGLDSDFNFFAGTHAVYVYANWSGTERALSLTEYQTEFSGEPNSQSGGLSLVAPYRPASGSPLLGAGDASVFPGESQVNVGLFPLLVP